nr:MAG TPA: hypothetical protein [Caudoviricetes sp.]
MENDAAAVASGVTVERTKLSRINPTSVGFFM